MSRYQQEITARILHHYGEEEVLNLNEAMLLVADRWPWPRLVPVKMQIVRALKKLGYRFALGNVWVRYDVTMAVSMIALDALEASK